MNSSPVVIGQGQWLSGCPHWDSCPTLSRCLHTVWGFDAHDEMVAYRDVWPEPGEDGRCKHFYAYDVFGDLSK